MASCFRFLNKLWGSPRVSKRKLRAGLRLPLRPGVELRTDPDRLRAAETGAELSLAPWQVALLPVLDGKQDLLRVARKAGVALEQADGFARTLLYCGWWRGRELASTARAAAEDPARHARDGPLRTLPEARFQCNSCGACCRNYALGPVRAKEAAAVRALALEEAFPWLEGTDPFCTGPRLPSGEPSFLFVTRTRPGGGSGCVFLQEDNGCALHARFGAEAKPLVCRLFPFGVHRTAVGLEVFDRGECETFDRSAFSGPTLEAELDGGPLEALVRDVPARLLVAPVVLGRGLALHVCLYARIETLLLSIVAEPIGTIVDAFAAVRAALGLFVQTVRRAPLHASPGRVVARFCGRAPPLFFAPGARDAGSAAARRRRAAVLGPAMSMLISVGEGLRSGGVGQVDGAEVFYRDLVPRFLVVAGCAAARFAQDAAPDGSAAHGARLDPARPEIDRFLRTLLRHLLLGKALLSVGAAPTLGLGWLGLLLELIAAGACSGAAADGRETVTPGDLAAAQVSVLAVMRDSAVGGALLRDQRLAREVVDGFGAGW